MTDAYGVRLTSSFLQATLYLYDEPEQRACLIPWALRSYQTLHGEPAQPVCLIPWALQPYLTFRGETAQYTCLVPCAWNPHQILHDEPAQHACLFPWALPLIWMKNRQNPSCAQWASFQRIACRVGLVEMGGWMVTPSKPASSN